MVEFASPWAWLLVVPVLLLHTGLQRWLTGRNQLAVPSLSHLRIGFSFRSWFVWVPAFLQLVGLLLCVTALARPRVAHRSVEVESVGLDILLALDTSGSMDQSDFTKNGRQVTRLEIAKGVIKKFVEGRPNDRIGIVVFGEQAFTQIPLTTDHTTLLDALAGINIGNAGRAGTAIGSAIAVSSKRLKELDAPDRLIILLTDGENNAGDIEPMQAAEAAAALDITLYSVGVGSKQAANSFFSRGGPDDRGLTRVSEVTGGRYFRATDSRTLEQIYDTIDTLEPSPAVVNELVDYEEHFRWYLLPGLVSLLVSFVLGRTVLRVGP